MTFNLQRLNMFLWPALESIHIASVCVGFGVAASHSANGWRWRYNNALDASSGERERFIMRAFDVRFYYGAGALR